MTEMSRSDRTAREEQDRPAALREQFKLPTGTIYRDGNTPGVLPRATAACVQQGIFDEWGRVCEHDTLLTDVCRGEGLVWQWGFELWTGALEPDAFENVVEEGSADSTEYVKCLDVGAQGTCASEY